MLIIEKIKHHFFTREFLLFLIIGIINTFNGTLLAYLYGLSLEDKNLAFNLGYITSNVIAYILNSLVIFQERLSWHKLIKFSISYIPNYLIQNLIVFIFYNMLNLPPIASYIIAAILGVPVTFLMVKIFAFGRK